MDKRYLYVSGMFMPALLSVLDLAEASCSRFKLCRREILTLLMLMLLAGCQQPSSIAPATQRANEEMRTIAHAMGTSQVPFSPQRVVVLDTTPLDAALALGIQPVGTIRYGQPPSYLGEAAQTIKVVGQYNQPSLETILQLQPDLILGAKSISEQLYPHLSRIAPTVFTEGAGQHWNWKNNFRLFAEALGRHEQAEQLIAEYEQRVVALKASLESPRQNTTASVLVISPRGIIAQTPRSFPGAVLQELGFARNAIQGTTEQFFVRLSREDLDAAEGDVLFLIHNAEWQMTSKADFVSDPLWSKLAVVQQGAVCEVPAEVWATGRSILAATQILTDVERCTSQVPN